MNPSHLLSFALVASAVIAVSCAGPGAGKSTFTEGDVDSTKSKTSGDDDDDTTTSTSSTSGAATGDTVFGAQTFTYKKPDENADEHGASHTGQTPLEGKDCTQANCHQTTSPWSFCGTVYSDKNGTAAGGEAEIGVVYGDNKVRSAMTDANGNFWLAAGDNPTGVKAIGIRKNGGKTITMATPLPTGDAGRACNSASCHGLATNRIYVQ